MYFYKDNDIVALLDLRDDEILEHYEDKTLV